MGTTTRGIDVSHYQGTIDWPSVAGSNVAFCFIKATQGDTYVDPYFSQNWQGSASAGLWHGAYHYGVPSVDPIAQAQYFYRTVGASGSQVLPPVLDLETLDGQSPTDVLQWTLAFLAATDTLFGRDTIVYTDAGFWQALQDLPGSQNLAQRPLWLAAYTAQPRVPLPWSNWTFWQYSSGSCNGGCPVAGVTGSVDQDLFAGSLAQLGALP